MVDLITQDDVEARLGRTLTAAEEARIDGLITDVSAAARRAAKGQQISAGTSTVRLTPSAAERSVSPVFLWERNVSGLWAVRPPQQPITEITTVVDDNEVAVANEWISGNLLYVYTSLPVTVTYNHGYDPVPDDVIGACCQIVGRALGTSPEDSGLTAETIQGYTYQRGSAAASGAFGMLPAEREIFAGCGQPAQPIRML